MMPARTAPAGTPHFISTEQETIVPVHGVGRMGLSYVTAARGRQRDYPGSAGFSAQLDGDLGIALPDLCAECRLPREVRAGRSRDDLLPPRRICDIGE